MDKIAIIKPDDFHSHLRQGEMLKKILPFSNTYGRVVAMGNTTPLIESPRDVSEYQHEILTEKPSFEPVMSVMLTCKTNYAFLTGAHLCGAKVLKFIPEGISTNSQGVGIYLHEIERYFPLINYWLSLPGTVFSVHLELGKNPKSGEKIPEINRETMGLPYAELMIEKLSGKVIFEHATTEKLIALVESAPANVAATLTVHHALLTYNRVYHCDGINPFNYCKPVAKFIYDRKAIVEAMISGNPKFFFGSDNAPHLPEKKTGKDPAAGIFMPGGVALSLLAEIFDNYGSLSELENFISKFGAEFYNLPLNKDFITIKKRKWKVPKHYNGIVPFMAGHELEWKIF